MLLTRPLLIAAAVLLPTSAGHVSARLHANAPLIAAPLVVSVDWLQRHYKDHDVVLVQVGEPAEYFREHIPGAQYMEMSQLAAAQTGPGLALELPSPEAGRAELEAMGISDNTHVVIYYGNDWLSPSTRLIHTLNYLGLGDHVSLLTGGMKAWKNAGHPVTDEPSRRPVHGRLSAVPTLDVTVNGDWMAAHLKTPGIAIVDARPPVSFNGMSHPGAASGHIPGAVNLPFTDVFDEYDALDDVATLERKFKDAGIAPGDTIIAYCSIGQQATAIVFAARVLGRTVKLYDGSMQDWTQRPGSTLETSPTPGGGK